MGLPRRILRLVNGLAMAGWPLLVWLALTYPGLRILLPLLALCFVTRLMLLADKTGPLLSAGRWLAGAGAVLIGASLLLRETHLLLWYPVVVNLCMLVLFTASLFSAMPLVERIARLREGELTPRAISYTRRVTQAWCLFFTGNGTMALVTCLLGDIKLWTLWNGILSYLLMGALFAAEWLIRQRMKRYDQ